MKKITVSEFRHKMKAIFDSVESGETIQICRHGRSIAVISPPFIGARVSAPDPAAARAYWKKARQEKGLKIPGMMELFLDERRRARY